MQVERRRQAFISYTACLESSLIVLDATQSTVQFCTVNIVPTQMSCGFSVDEDFG
jgi:hypothetical protein